MLKSLRYSLFCLGLLMQLFAVQTMAKGEYMTRAEFLAAAFPAAAAPQKQVLWLTADLKKQAGKILNRPYAGLRLRYWQQGERTAWVFEEIGKDLPITIGVVVDSSGINQIHILAFRESRGWEVRYPAFRRQFKGVKLTEQNKLDRSIDGVTGATLSVRAVKKVARLALYLHAQTEITASSTNDDTSKTHP